MYQYFITAPVKAKGEILLLRREQIVIEDTQTYSRARACEYAYTHESNRTRQHQNYRYIIYSATRGGNSVQLE